MSAYTFDELKQHVDTYAGNHTGKDALKNFLTVVLRCSDFKLLSQCMAHYDQLTGATPEPAVTENATVESPVVSFFESIALPLAARGWRVCPCYPGQKDVHTKLVQRPFRDSFIGW